MSDTFISVVVGSDKLDKRLAAVSALLQVTDYFEDCLTGSEIFDAVDYFNDLISTKHVKGNIECKEVDCQLWCDDDYIIPDQQRQHTTDCQLHDDD